MGLQAQHFRRLRLDRLHRDLESHIRPDLVGPALVAPQGPHQAIRIRRGVGVAQPSRAPHQLRDRKLEGGLALGQADLRRDVVERQVDRQLRHGRGERLVLRRFGGRRVEEEVQQHRAWRVRGQSLEQLRMHRARKRPWAQDVQRALVDADDQDVLGWPLCAVEQHLVVDGCIGFHKSWLAVQPDHGRRQQQQHQHPLEQVATAQSLHVPTRLGSPVQGEVTSKLPPHSAGGDDSPSACSRHRQ